MPIRNFSKNLTSLNINIIPNDHLLIGPVRVFPGKLSVSRTFGDIEAKIIKFGGLPNVITAIPEIFSYKITDDTDFIILGCDGIYDCLSNEDLVKCVWMTTLPSHKSKNIHSQCGLAIDLVIKSCLMRSALDNLSCLIISFSSFKNKSSDKSLNIENNSNDETNKDDSIWNLSDLESRNNVDLSPMINGLFPGNSHVNIPIDPLSMLSNNDKIKQKPSNFFKNNTDTMLTAVTTTFFNNATFKEEIENNEAEEDYKEYSRQDLGLHSGIKFKSRTSSEKNLNRNLEKMIDTNGINYRIKDILKPDLTNFQIEANK